MNGKRVVLPRLIFAVHGKYRNQHFITGTKNIKNKRKILQIHLFRLKLKKIPGHRHRLVG